MYPFFRTSLHGGYILNKTYEQPNLLGLNAEIEDRRARRHGRTFVGTKKFVKWLLTIRMQHIK